MGASYDSRGLRHVRIERTEGRKLPSLLHVYALILQAVGLRRGYPLMVAQEPILSHGAAAGYRAQPSF
jgi:hypothetical protein